MIENIKPVESLTVADLRAHPVWEYLLDHEIDETMVRPVQQLPVETLDHRIVGALVRLGNGLEVWGLLGNFDVKDSRQTQHFLTLSIERAGKWFHLARYFDEYCSADEGPEGLARFLDLGVDDVFPIAVDVRRYVRGYPAALAVIVPKEPHEKLTMKELLKLLSASGPLRGE